MKFRDWIILCILIPSCSTLKIGRGIADMTGPAAEVNLMGYANPAQVAGGIHTRLFARAFIFADEDSEEVGGKRICYVSADIGMGSDLLTQKVIERLGDEQVPGMPGPGWYEYENLVISGTHTHSSAAGFLQYTLFQVTSWGFVNQTFHAYVEGVADAVARAHADLSMGRVASLASGYLEKNMANINRSPTSYLLNPEEERSFYEEAGGDTDLAMLQLLISGNDGAPLGLLNWFSVHGTSLNNTNRLLSGDNRGVASLLLEEAVNGAIWDTQVLPGSSNESFVAAFASTNLGDVSPNTGGARCIGGPNVSKKARKPPPHDVHQYSFQSSFELLKFIHSYLFALCFTLSRRRGSLVTPSPPLALQTTGTCRETNSALLRGLAKTCTSPWK